MALPTTNLAHRYIATTGITITGQGVSEWQDQVGTAHLTQTTDGSRPIVQTVRGKTSVYFSSSRFLDLPAITVNKAAKTWYVICRCATPGSSMALIYGNTIGNLWLHAVTGGNKVNNIGPYSGHGIETIFTAALASATYTGCGGQYVSSTADSGTANSASRVGLWSGTSFPLTGDIFEILLYDAGHDPTGADHQAVLDYASETYGASSRGNETFIAIEGDSISANSTVSWCQQLLDDSSLVHVPKIFNDAAGGAKLSAMITQTAVLNNLTWNTANTNLVAVMLGGTNDIGGDSATTSTVTGYLDTWVASHNSVAKTVVMTITPRTGIDAAKEATRVAVNDYIKTTLDCDVVIDIAADSRMANASDTTYYSDGLHPTTLGYSVMAELIGEALANQSWLEYTTAPSITTTSAATGIVGTAQPFTLTLMGSTGLGTYTLTGFGVTVPGSIVSSASVNTFNGTPLGAGSGTVTASMTSAAGTASASATLVSAQALAWSDTFNYADGPVYGHGGWGSNSGGDAIAVVESGALAGQNDIVTGCANPTVLPKLDYTKPVLITIDCEFLGEITDGCDVSLYVGDQNSNVFGITAGNMAGRDNPTDLQILGVTTDQSLLNATTLTISPTTFQIGVLLTPTESRYLVNNTFVLSSTQSALAASWPKIIELNILGDKQTHSFLVNSIQVYGTAYSVIARATKNKLDVDIILDTDSLPENYVSVYVSEDGGEEKIFSSDIYSFTGSADADHIYVVKVYASADNTGDVMADITIPFYCHSFIRNRSRRGMTRSF